MTGYGRVVGGRRGWKSGYLCIYYGVLFGRLGHGFWRLVTGILEARR
jgi:hypothetical protein